MSRSGGSRSRSRERDGRREKRRSRSHDRDGKRERRSRSGERESRRERRRSPSPERRRERKQASRWGEKGPSVKFDPQQAAAEPPPPEGLSYEEELEARAKNKSKKSRDFSSIMTETLSGANKKRGGDDSVQQNTRYDWGKPDEDEEDGAEEIDPEKKVKPDFALSGALATDVNTGNVVNGIVLKFVEPADARMPSQDRHAARWRFYVFKGDELIETLHISKQSAFLVGREKKVCDIYMRHPSLSKQHAVIQYRLREIKNDETGKLERHVLPYIMDLGSTNGTFLNGDRIEETRYYELREKDTLKFGESSREYVLLTDKTSGEEE